MSTQLDLKEIERRAFRSTYQDGLWDMELGLIVIAMSIFIYRPATGYSPINIILMVLMFTLANGLFQVGKKYITLPRMGQVQFGEIRKRKKRTLAFILGVFILFQVGLVGVTAHGWTHPVLGAKLNTFLGVGNSSLPMVAAIGSLIVGTSMLVIAFYSDFQRGYYIAVLMSLAVFLMILLNQPAYPILIGGSIFLPGLVFFVRFLKTYPLPREDIPHE